MIYCDTSLLATALLPEPAAADVQGWLARHDGQLVISGWVHAELAGAVARKRRMGLLSAGDAERVLTAWATVRGALASVQVTAEHFEEAARALMVTSAGLRAGDALHLAIAARTGHALASLDRKLLRAAGERGVAAVDPLAG